MDFSFDKLIADVMGATMDPQAKLAAEEALVIDALLKKLVKMTGAYAAADYHKSSELVHLEEMTKLCHRVRSLLDKNAIAKP